MIKILVTLILITSSVYGYDLRYYSEVFPIFEGKTITSHRPWDTKAPHFSEIQRDYKRGAFSDYDSFIKYLIDKEPGLKNRNILIHQSESQQMSSFEYPRVVLYKGTNFYAFSDHPGQRDRRVEIIHARKDSLELEMKEIVFKAKSVEFRNDPKSCLLCHGSPAKPLWKSYGLWTVTTYGDAAVNIPFVEDQYKKLLATAPAHPATRYLNLPESVEREQGDTERSDIVWGFTNSVATVFFRNWFATNLSKKKLSYGDGLHILKILAECEGQPQPTEDSKVFIKEFIDPSVFLFASIRERAYRKFGTHVENLGGISDVESAEGVYGRDFSFITSLWLYGIPTASFTMHLDVNTHINKAPGDNIEHMLGVLYQVRPDLFTNISWKPMGLTFDRQQLSSLKVDCASLERELENYPYRKSKKPYVPSFRRVDSDLPALTRCIQCHVTHVAETPNAKAPTIPFNDATALAELLRRPHSTLKANILKRVSSRGPDQMPPGTGLTPKETEAMKEFLENLE